MQSIGFWVRYKLQQLRDREDGATAVEYGLMIALIAVTIILTVQALGLQLNTLFQTVTTKLAGVIPGGGTN